MDHLHEHFVDPVRIVRGHYVLPQRPGYSIQIQAETLEKFAYPDGEMWRETQPMNGKIEKAVLVGEAE